MSGPVSILEYLHDHMPQTGQSHDNASNHHVFLNVSGKVYRSTLAVLTKSPFFRYHIAEPGNRDADGSVVVHADPGFFENILHYLQHGAYPLFVAPNGYHDVPKYLACIKEARYFHLFRLVDWLEKGRYAEAYRIEYGHKILRGEEVEAGAGGVSQTVLLEGSKVSITFAEQRIAEWGRNMVAVCPRGIAEHRGRKDDCWRVCQKGREEPAWEHDAVPYAVFFLSTKKLVIDHGLLRDPNW